MLKKYEFGEWLPDLANNVVTKAVNVRAIGNGYAPLRSPLPITSALPAAFNGGGAFIASDGGTTLMAASTTQAYKYTGLIWSSIATVALPQTCRFAQFGDNVLFCGGAAIQSQGLLTGTGSTPTDSPTAIDIAPVRDFVMCITTDNKIQWCQFNNSSVWTTGVNQADYQPSLWGSAKRIIGGEYAVLVTDRAVVRITYVGSINDIIFQFDQIFPEVGCMAPNSVCNVGRLVFFLSQRGFMMCDGNEVQPLGDEKFNKWLFSTYSRADIAKMWGAVDPRNSVVLWGIPGTPGKIIAYNWVLKRGVTLEIDVTGMFTGLTSSVSIDSLDATYGNLDAIPNSLDDPGFQGGDPALVIVDGSNVLNSLAGENLEATIRLQNVEPSPGVRSRIRRVRPITDAISATATIDARMRAGDAEGVIASASMRANGKMPIRSNGRYNSVEISIPQGTDWSYLQGCELEFDGGDVR